MSSAKDQTEGGGILAEYPNRFDLSGHRVLITGAAQGIGYGIAECFLDWGASVALADLKADRVETARATLAGEAGARVVAAPLDVTDETSVSAAFGSLWRDWGGVDLTVNCAGILSVANVADLTLSDWRRVMDVNATGVFVVSREAVRRMLAAGQPGSIVSLASIAGKRGDPRLAHYSASKFAVVGFTQALAREVGGNDITVNAICPGVVKTQMIADLASGSGTDTDDWITHQAIPRAQTPADIAFAAGFLHLSRAVTGQSLLVDGGTLFS